MEYMDAVLRLIELVIWPAVVLVLVFRFRIEIQDLTARLRRIKHHGTEIDFGETLQNAEITARSLPLPESRLQSSPPWRSEVGYCFRPSLSSLLEGFPRSSDARAAILEAWTTVETTLRLTAERFGISPRQYSEEVMFLRDLEVDGKIPPGTLSLYQDLRDMRNTAAHAAKLDTKHLDVQRYHKLSVRLASILEQVIV